MQLCQFRQHMKIKIIIEHIRDLISPMNKLDFTDLYKNVYPKTAGRKQQQKILKLHVGYISNKMIICLVINQFQEFKRNEIIQIYVFFLTTVLVFWTIITKPN